MKPLAALAAVMLIAVIVAAVSHTPDIQSELRLYCEMQQIHIDSGGEFGWPDFRGLRSECGI